MADPIHWTAVCQYPGKDQFRFYSSAFVVEHWADMERAAKETVEAEWARISPHPAPPVVELVPGRLLHESERGVRHG